MTLSSRQVSAVGKDFLLAVLHKHGGFMGKELLTNVISNTGLPEEPLRREFSTLLEKNGLTESSLTLDSLREILAEYLQDVFCEAQETLSKQQSS